MGGSTPSYLLYITSDDDNITTNNLIDSTSLMLSLRPDSYYKVKLLAVGTSEDLPSEIITILFLKVNYNVFIPYH